MVDNGEYGLYIPLIRSSWSPRCQGSGEGIVVEGEGIRANSAAASAERARSDRIKKEKAPGSAIEGVTYK